MPNPFERLGKPRPQDIDYDEWGGAFECFECRAIVGIAKYIKKERVLTWQCEDGHISKLEDVDD